MISVSQLLKKNIKFILVAFTLFLSQNGVSQDKAQEVTPKETSVVLEEAYKVAEKENKNVMVVFRASWCKWCKRMLSNMNDYKLEPLFSRNYVITTLTVKESNKNKHLENPGAYDLLLKYRAENSGIPYFLIFDAKGKLLEKSENSEAMNLGCPASKKEVSRFQEILKNTSDLTKDELDLIGERYLLEK